MKQDKPLHSLIPLEDFKALLGIDDRDDKMSRFCLVTATCAMEEYCRRRLYLKTIHQTFKEWPDFTVYLNEYPVREILSVYALFHIKEPEYVEPDLYRLEPAEENANIPYSLIFTPALRRFRGMTALKVIFKAGYKNGGVPADLSSACFELAVWNMNRYKGRRIGMIGNVRGSGVYFANEFDAPCRQCEMNL